MSADVRTVLEWVVLLWFVGSGLGGVLACWCLWPLIRVIYRELKDLR